MAHSGRPVSLAAPPRPWPLDHLRSLGFFRDLGVAERPRPRARANDWSGQAGQWRQLPEYRAAATCADGHPYTMGEPQGWHMDRLDEQLALVVDADRPPGSPTGCSYWMSRLAPPDPPQQSDTKPGSTEAPA